MRLIKKCSPLLFILFLSCGSEVKNEVPKNLIPAPKMEAFLRDIHQLESSLLLSGIRQDSANTLFKVLEKDIYKKHKLDSAMVGVSLKYYTENVELLDSIYRKLRLPPDTKTNKQR
jgi:hypothetical protein